MKSNKDTVDVVIIIGFDCLAAKFAKLAESQRFGDFIKINKNLTQVLLLIWISSKYWHQISASFYEF